METIHNYSTTFILKIASMRGLILSIVFLLTFQLNSKAQFQHKVELQISALGNVQYLAIPKIKPISEVGVLYQRYLFPQTYVVFGLQGNSRTFQEASTDTLDMFTGSVKYRNWMGSVGIRHLFKEEIVETFNFFAEADFFYSRINADGNYSGGRFGEEFFNYRKFEGVGLGFKFGVIYQFLTPFYIGVNAAAYISGGRLQTIESNVEPAMRPEFDNLNANQSLNQTQLEIRVGKMF
jgi:hypothetical protein